MKQTATKIFNTVFSRFNITILLVLLQAGYFALLVFRLSNYAEWMHVTMAALGVATCIFIMWRDYNPAYKISWMFFIGLLPSLGVLCYILFGDKRPTRRMRNTLAPQEKKHAADLVQEASVLMCMGATVKQLRHMVHIHPTLSELLLAAAEA